VKRQSQNTVVKTAAAVTAVVSNQACKQFFLCYAVKYVACVHLPVLPAQFHAAAAAQQAFCKHLPLPCLLQQCSPPSFSLCLQLKLESGREDSDSQAAGRAFFVPSHRPRHTCICLSRLILFSSSNLASSLTTFNRFSRPYTARQGVL